MMCNAPKLSCLLADVIERWEKEGRLRYVDVSVSETSDDGHRPLFFASSVKGPINPPRLLTPEQFWKEMNNG